MGLSHGMTASRPNPASCSMRLDDSTVKRVGMDLATERYTSGMHIASQATFVETTSIPHASKGTWFV